jgi:anti-sigma regulatory factor (Ser/Thr protein kinase)
MPGVRRRGEKIRSFILRNITGNKNIAVITARKFNISTQAVYKHIDRLASNNLITKKSGEFILQSRRHAYIYRNIESLSEDTVWETDVKKHFAGLPDNIRRIWTYGFLEIFNNAIEHSGGKEIRVIIDENSVFKTMNIADNGMGIFKNIKAKFNLSEEKDAILELNKGKRTTDKTRHSGQGIFFVSKIFDDFMIASGGIIFSSNHIGTERKDQAKIGKTIFSTLVRMCIVNDSKKQIKTVFDAFSTEIPGDFDKTVVPVHLANSDDLISRSQARRVLSGLELFKEVILDFKDVEYIGQAFADEIFRVFPSMNPNTSITSQNANTDIQNMINRAKNTRL